MDGQSSEGILAKVEKKVEQEMREEWLPFLWIIMYAYIFVKLMAIWVPRIVIKS